MTAVVGALLLAGAVLLFCWAYIQHRRPGVERGLFRHEFASQMLCFAIMGIFAGGLACFARLLSDGAGSRFGTAEIATLAIGAAAFLLGLEALRRAWRRLRLSLPAESVAARADGQGRPRAA